MIADIFEHFRDLSALAGIEQKLGAEHINLNAAPPRIIWVPMVDQYRRGRARGVTPIGEKRRHIGTRIAGVRIRLWAAAAPASTATAVEHFRAAEELLRKMLLALHQQAFGIVSILGIEWIGGDGQEVGQLGRACELTVTFEIPIFEQLDEADVAEALVTIGTQTMTADFPPEGTSGNDASGTPGV